MRWLLLRGLVREQRHWLDFADRFRRDVRGPDGAAVDVVTLDLPGFGTQNDCAPPASIAAFVDDVRARWLSRRGGDDESWGIFAVSLGGMVALDWLARHPQDFRAGIVVNTSAGDVSPMWERFAPAMLPRVVVAWMGSDRWRERIVLGFTRNTGDLEAAADEYARIAKLTPPRALHALLQIRAASRSKTPTRVDVPTLVLCSDTDRLVSWRCSERIAQRLDLPLRKHHGAGHDLPLDAPQWTIDVVNDWSARGFARTG